MVKEIVRRLAEKSPYRLGDMKGDLEADLGRELETQALADAVNEAEWHGLAAVKQARKVPSPGGSTETTSPHPSPFRSNRYEREEDRRHVYFLIPEDEQLEELKSTYIIGTRGTGKTTLLKSLFWKERIESPSLQRALKGDLRFDRALPGGLIRSCPNSSSKGWANGLPTRSPNNAICSPLCISI